ncbi:MAG: hypothetical protein ACREXS_02710 [Gammaproteobacteria bacterium]
MTGRLEQFLELLSIEITGAEDFAEQPRADSLTGVHRNNGGSTIGVPKKMMATLDPNTSNPAFFNLATNSLPVRLGSKVMRRS